MLCLPVALLPTNLDLTDHDFDSLRGRLIALVKSVFPDWSDFEVASFGNVLIELFAFVGDVLGFYQDALARESRLSTATQRKNVIALAKMLGYRLHGAGAATAGLEFRLAQPAVARVTIPEATVVRTQEVIEPSRFQLLAPVVFEPGEIAARGVVEHSQTHKQLFDVRGLADLAVRLDFGPFLDGSAVVSTAQGVFSEVDNFLNSLPTDRHFTVVVDQNDKATLHFGNGACGVIPTGTISVSYKVGGGVEGNVDAERLVVVEGAFSDAHGHSVQLSVTNLAAASGGTNRQTTESAKMLAPETLRASTRCVCREDFEINARRLPGVARVLMLTSNEDHSIPENSGILFVIPQGGGLPSSELRQRVHHQVTEVYPCTLTFQVAVQDPVYRTVDVYARVFFRSGASSHEIASRIRSALAEYFRATEPDGTPNRNVDFGHNLRDEDSQGELAWSDLFNVVRDVPGVRKIGDDRLDFTLNGLPADLQLAPLEFPILGTITLRDGATGALL